MNDIYRCYWLTIVALDGVSAKSSLPRIGLSTNRINHQTEAIVKNTKLLTAMPTLQQQVKASKWATRAWTYQEAVLSPRCVYFTQEQVYFECNMLQCCESIDETNSPFHNMPYEKRREVANSCVCHGYTQNALGTGIYRDPMSEVNSKLVMNKRGLEKYNELICNFSLRDITFSGDALNACSALVQRLQGSPFERGFFWGLPIEVIHIALLWSHKGTYCRRHEFPSWSSVGWQGKLSSATSLIDYRRCGEGDYSPSFRAWKRTHCEYILLYKNQELQPIHRKPEDSKPNIIYDAGYAPITVPEFDITLLSRSELRRCSSSKDSFSNQT
jgi:hypothetical protein